MARTPRTEAAAPTCGERHRDAPQHRIWNLIGYKFSSLQQERDQIAARSPNDAAETCCSPDELELVLDRILDDMCDLALQANELRAETLQDLGHKARILLDFLPEDDNQISNLLARSLSADIVALSPCDRACLTDADK